MHRLAIAKSLVLKMLCKITKLYAFKLKWY